MRWGPGVTPTGGRTSRRARRRSSTSRASSCAISVADFAALPRRAPRASRRSAVRRSGRLRSSSRRRRSVVLLATSAPPRRSYASCAIRAEPVSTPVRSRRRRRPARCRRPVSRYSRSCFEWSMPRDFNRYSTRLRSPFASIVPQRQPGIPSTTTRVRSMSSICSPDGRQAREHRRDAARLADVGEAHERRVDLGQTDHETPRSGSTDDDGRLDALDVAIHSREVHLESVEARPRGLERRAGPASTILAAGRCPPNACCARSARATPRTRTYRQRWPRSHAAATNDAVNVDLPVPARPEISTLDPR